MLDKICKDLCKIKEVKFTEIVELYNITKEIFKTDKKYNLETREEEYIFRDKMFILALDLRKNGFDDKKVELFLKAVGYYYSF